MVEKGVLGTSVLKALNSWLCIAHGYPDCGELSPRLVGSALKLPCSQTLTMRIRAEWRGSRLPSCLGEPSRHPSLWP